MRKILRTGVRLPGALGVAGTASFSPARAQVVVKQAESVLPPGQSGSVSVAGLPRGTVSPHLNDQTQLFTAFNFKSALFNQPGETQTPRAGVRSCAGYGVPSITGATDFDAWWGVGYAVAKDRLFQLEPFRRATSGRLAEILGERSSMTI